MMLFLPLSWVGLLCFIRPGSAFFVAKPETRTIRRTTSLFVRPQDFAAGPIRPAIPLRGFPFIFPDDDEEEEDDEEVPPVTKSLPAEEPEVKVAPEPEVASPAAVAPDPVAELERKLFASPETETIDVEPEVRTPTVSARSPDTNTDLVKPDLEAETETTSPTQSFEATNDSSKSDPETSTLSAQSPDTTTDLSKNAALVSPSEPAATVATVPTVSPPEPKAVKAVASASKTDSTTTSGVLSQVAILGFPILALASGTYILRNRDEKQKEIEEEVKQRIEEKKKDLEDQSNLALTLFGASVVSILYIVATTGAIIP